MDMEAQGEMESDGEMDWRLEKKTHKDKSSHMFYNLMDPYHKQDVVLIIGQGSKNIYYGHSFVLHMNSKYLSDRLEDVREPRFSNFVRWQVTIPEVNSKIFRYALQFMYTEEVEITSYNMIGILQTARLLQIQALEEQCRNFIKEKAQVNVENAVNLFQLSTSADLTCLRERALDFILENAVEVLLKSPDILTLDLEDICSILGRDELALSEIDVFCVAKRWAENFCLERKLEVSPENLRLALDKALYLIRFPLVVLDDFRVHIRPTNILKESEILQLFFDSNSTKDVFNSTKRKVGVLEPPPVSNQVLPITLPDDPTMSPENSKESSERTQTTKGHESLPTDARKDETLSEIRSEVSNFHDPDIPLIIPRKTNYLSAGLLSHHYKFSTISSFATSKPRYFNKNNVLPAPCCSEIDAVIRKTQSDYNLPYDVWCEGMICDKNKQKQLATNQVALSQPLVSKKRKENPSIKAVPNVEIKKRLCVVAIRID